MGSGVPITSDEALYEISTIKEDVNKKLLKAIKESAIDCNLHTDSKDDLQCFSFGSGPWADPFSYQPAYSDEETDKVGDINKKKITWKGLAITYDGVEYALNKGTGEVYTMESYKRGAPVLIGHMRKAGPKKYRLEFI